MDMMKKNPAERLVARVIGNLPIGGLTCRLRRSIVTFTFDDFPKSSWEAGGPILAGYRAPATFFVSGSFCGRKLNGIQYYSAEDLAEIAVTGHEIGCHTFQHQRAPYSGSAALESDIRTNTRFIAQAAGVIPETFAYPFGHASVRTKLFFMQRFACCRGTEPGINRGLLDRSQLRAIDLGINSVDHYSIGARLAKAVLRPSWIIFFTHDVDDRPSAHGSTPEILERALAMTRDAGLEILTMKDGWRRACGP